jgi:hypothetical protein
LKVKINRRVLAVGSVLVLTLAFGAVRPAWAVDEVDRIRQKCEEFFMSLTKNEYNLYVKGKKPKYATYYKDYSYLFKPKKVELLRQRSTSTSDPAEARAMDLLATALAHAAVVSYAAADIDQMYEFMMTADVSFDGEQIKFGDVRKVIAREEDRDRRRQIYIAFNTHLEPLTVFKTGIISKMDEHVGEWGFGTYLRMLLQTKELDLDTLESQAVQFLDATDEAYTAELTRLLQEHSKVDLRMARGYDIPYILRGQWLDGNLEAQQWETVAKDALEGMGLKAEAAKLESSEERFCGESIMPRVFALRVPDEIKMCYSPIGGTCDIGAYLYLRGKAEYVASIKQKEYWELGRLGNQAMYDAAGFVFQGLTENPGWLTGVAGLDPALAASIARHRAFVSLFEARRSCVSTLFQIGAYSNTDDPEGLYSDLLKKYMKWDPILDRSRAPLEMNDLETAWELQGQYLAAQLRDALESKFGDEWYKSSEAGDYLKGLWAPGYEVTASGAAAQLGYDKIDPAYLVAELTGALATQ